MIPKALHNSIQKFKWSSIFVKYFTAIFIALLIIISSLAYVVIAGINEKYKTREAASASIEISKIDTILENTYNSISTYNYSLQNQDAFSYICNLDDMFDVSFETANNFNVIRESTNNFKNTNLSISSIYVYFLKGD